jgi:hypothetical protein
MRAFKMRVDREVVSTNTYREVVSTNTCRNNSSVTHYLRRGHLSVDRTLRINLPALSHESRWRER